MVGVIVLRRSYVHGERTKDILARLAGSSVIILLLLSFCLCT